MYKCTSAKSPNGTERGMGLHTTRWMKPDSNTNTTNDKHQPAYPPHCPSARGERGADKLKQIERDRNITKREGSLNLKKKKQATRHDKLMSDRSII